MTRASALEPESVRPHALRELRARFRGPLLLPGEQGYDDHRRVWNADIDRRPALIARCAGTDDVQAVIRLAREHDWPISVRGSGRGIAGHAVADATVMIDLSLMRSVSVDPASRRGVAAPGTTWGEFDLAAQRHGLATTGGTVSEVSVGGLTLLGGFGHLLRRHGLTVDNLQAATLVTAEGDVLHVDSEQHPDLLWGLRGGGGNFGIATELTLDLHAVGPLVLAGPIYWPLDQAPQVLRFLRERAPAAPDELGMMLTVHRAPPLPFLATEHHGIPAFGLVLSWTGAPAEGGRAVAPFRQLGRPMGDLIRSVPYRWLQTLLDAGAAPGHAAYWRSVRLPALTDAAIDEIIALARALPTPSSALMGWVIGGAATRVADDATAVGHRETGFELRLMSTWPPGDREAEAHVAWVRDGWRRLSAHGSGQYPTFLTDEDAAAVRAAYGDGFARLTALKDRYDPTNVFRRNANIPPTGQRDIPPTNE